MNWKLVIGLILLAPTAALTVAGYVKWTLYAWRSRHSHTPLNMIGTGREHWLLWIFVHFMEMTIAGIWLLQSALEGEQQ